jgi:cell division protein FtsI (penicillin-binding protein 3)
MDKTARRPLTAPIPRMRFVLLAGIFLLWAGTIVLRLVWLQVVDHKIYVERAARQQERTFEVAPRRGVLYDRNLQALAMTVLTNSIYAVPSEITNKQATARILAGLVHEDTSDPFTSEKAIEARLDGARNFAWVARKVAPDVAQRVGSLGLKGIYFQQEYKRFYPDDQLAAQVLGYVSLDDSGLGGIEHRYDADLHGAPGRMLTAVDARQQSFGSVERNPEPGENLVLTLDAHIQFIAERALDSAMQRTQAVNGTVVVQDPNTGQILALAVRPAFDPNDVRHVRPSMLHDNAVSGIYEPGSVFKLVTYSAAMNEGLTNPDEVLDGQNGKIVVAGRLVHDWHRFGKITVTEALEHSCDVCAIKVGLRLGPQKFYDYIRAFGFGQRSGIELPAETRGLLRPPNRWQASSIASLAMGQEVGVTPVQAISMISTIANGGVYLPPHILLEKTDQVKGTPQLQPAAFHPEDSVPETLPPGAHRVITTMTAAELRKMMEGVVLFGTGKFVGLNGYSAGGKSGTAQKVDPGTHTYSRTDYIASFGGFAPVNRPAISVLVVLDSPRKGHHGGEVAGPVFGQVVQQTLEYIGVPHDMEVKPARLMAKVQTPKMDEETGDHDHPGDLQALFAAVNNLPADDPLRQSAQTGPANTGQQPPAEVSDGSGDRGRAGQQDVIAQQISSVHTDAKYGNASDPSARTQTAHLSAGSVRVNTGSSITVPSFVGQPMRKAVETAASLGLGVQVFGSGAVREQAPVAGTQVPPGTEVVLRFAR